MKLNLSKEWCMAAAEREGDAEIGAGVPDEPVITINGEQLTEAQAAAVRVAISSFHFDMSQVDPLGEDMHGRAMAKLYRDRLTEVMVLILRGPA